MGGPGDHVTFTANLDTGGAVVGGVQNDITFDSTNTRIAALPSGMPDCTLNPDLSDKEGLFIFRPNGCTGGMCTMVRTAVFRSSPPINPIPDGSTLYTCTVNIAPDAAPGEYALAVSRVQLTNPLGTPVAGAGGADGKVVVALPTETPTITQTATATASETPTATISPTLTAAATPTATPIACVGDCNNSGAVSIEEIISMVDSALAVPPLSTCPAGDANGDGSITVNEIVTAVNNALNGCRNPQSTASAVTGRV
jgi:hypothetical protein